MFICTLICMYRHTCVSKCVRSNLSRFVSPSGFNKAIKNLPMADKMSAYHFLHDVKLIHTYYRCRRDCNSRSCRDKAHAVRIQAFICTSLSTVAFHFISVQHSGKPHVTFSVTRIPASALKIQCCDSGNVPTEARKILSKRDTFPTWGNLSIQCGLNEYTNFFCKGRKFVWSFVRSCYDCQTVLWLCVEVNADLNSTYPLKLYRYMNSN